MYNVGQKQHFLHHFYFFSLSFTQYQLHNTTIIVAKSTCQSTTFCFKNLICDIIVTQMEFRQLTNKQLTMHILLVRIIIQHFTQNLQNGSLIPLDLQSSGTAIHNKRQACGFLRPITCWTTTTNLTVEIFVIEKEPCLHV